MPPEQAQGKVEEIDERSDVYSLGASLYEWIAGRPPFNGSVFEVLRRVVEETPQPPSRYNPGVVPGLDGVCLKAMAKNREDRHQSALELSQDLERFE